MTVIVISSTSKSTGIPVTHDQYGVSGSGNGTLTYPIGLITVDEAALAGGTYNINNADYWLWATSSMYWTMSPAIYSGGANIWFVSGQGQLYWATDIDVGSGRYLRPVISLKESTMTTGGDGTAAHPYKVAY